MREKIHLVLLLTLFAVPLFARVISQPASLNGRFGAYLLGDDELADDASQAGLSFFIHQYRWEQIEPERDMFGFGSIDTWYREVLRPQKLSGVINLRTGQCWATDNSYDPELGVELNDFASAPPLDYDDYYDFIYTTVDHFRGRIEHFIIENDPVTKQAWYGTPDEYIELCRVAYDAAKAANPNCVVIANKFPAMAFGYIIAGELFDRGQYQEAMDFWNGYHSRRDERYQVASIAELQNWLESDFGLWAVDFSNAIMSREQSSNMDAIGVNYYLHYDYIDDVIGWLFDRMDENGYHLPIFDLEHGVKDDRQVVSDTAAAQELVKGLTIMQSLGITTIAWYPFSIDSVSHNFEYLKPLYDFQNQEHLPAYYSMQTMNECFSRYHFIDHVKEDPYALYTFMNIATEQVDLAVLWSDSGDITVSVPFPGFADYAVVQDSYGAIVRTRFNDGEDLDVPIGASPVFVRWKETGVGTHERAGDR
jgi:hypothetical protein